MFVSHQSNFDWGTSNFASNPEKSDSTLHQLARSGYNFTGWDYGSATITSTVTVTPEFEEVNMSVLYVFGGVIATFVVGAVIFTRF